MRIVIEIDPHSHSRSVTAESTGLVPAIVHDSVNRMADQLIILHEIYHGKDVDTLFFSDSAYLDDAELPIDFPPLPFGESV
jgi:hypothetical protein